MTMRLQTFHPFLLLRQHEWLTACAAAGMEVMVTSGLTRPDEPPSTWRGFGLAFSYVPLINGRFPIEEIEHSGDWSMWRGPALVGESLGLAWGARDPDVTDPTELRLTLGLTLAQLRAGERQPAHPALRPESPAFRPKARTVKAAKAGQKTQAPGKRLRRT